MSSSLSSEKQIGDAFGAKTGLEEFAAGLEGMDSSPQEIGFRVKLKRFWQRTRIPSVMKKVVEGSKILFSRLNPRSTPRSPSRDATQSGANHSPPRKEIVKFPGDVFHSPASSSDEAILSPSSLARTPSPNGLGSAIAKLAPKATPSPIPVNDPIIADPPTASEIANESFSGFRYKETLGKQKSFPEIKLGVVNCRVRWLEPIMSGEKSEFPVTGRGSEGNAGFAASNEKKIEPHECEKHPSNVPVQITDMGEVEQAPDSQEWDDESTFDDSPRLFRHRLPKEEPKPWVEPGTVAKRAMWLQPVLSGTKSMRGGCRDFTSDK